MAKKSQPVQTRKQVTNTITIERDPTRVARGHMAHRSGSGTHDNRPKRLRTRSAQNRQWKNEY